jgi:carbonic anhydrase
LTDLGRRREETAESQRPIAAILGCSDSRVPVEIVFDQRLGDLFVVRVAGNGAGPSQVASLRFAVERLGVPLVLVLGHSGCGAVRACLQSPRRVPRALGPILDPIRRVVRAVEEIRQATPVEEWEGLTVRANVAAVVKALRGKLGVPGGGPGKTGVSVVGAVYDLRSGRVEFWEEGDQTGSRGEKDLSDGTEEGTARSPKPSKKENGHE